MCNLQNCLEIVLSNTNIYQRKSQWRQAGVSKDFALSIRKLSFIIDMPE